ncbi:MAG: hypothetical protein V1754_09120 [Pseudomonadota bacterium]
MDCKSIQSLLYKEPNPDRQKGREIWTHLENCPTCAAVKKDIDLIGDELSSLPLPKLPEEFEKELVKKLSIAEKRGAGIGKARVQQQKGKISNWLFSRPALVAVAASFVIVMIGSVVLMKNPRVSEEPVMSTFVCLELTVYTDAFHPDAHFTVVLPEGLELSKGLAEMFIFEKGQDGLVEWRSELHPGMNQIKLPLLAKISSTTVQAQLGVGQNKYFATATLDGSVSKGHVPEEMKDGKREVKANLAWVIGRSQKQKTRSKS